jgi:Tfp pilus assembly protein PilZ
VVLRLELRLAEKADWIKVFDPRDSTLFVPHEEPPEIGESVRLDVIAGSSGPRVILRGKVIARRVKGDGALPRGFSMALGPDEREKVNYLNGFVRGGLLDLRERRRLPLRFKCSYGGLRGTVSSYTRDLNEEGLFIVSEDPLPEESEIHILLTVPVRSQPIPLVGVVSHTVVVEDEDTPGMGIRLQFKGEEAAEMIKVVDELESMFISNRLPEEYLI